MVVVSETHYGSITWHVSLCISVKVLKPIMPPDKHFTHSCHPTFLSRCHNPAIPSWTWFRYNPFHDWMAGFTVMDIQILAATNLVTKPCSD